MMTITVSGSSRCQLSPLCSPSLIANADPGEARLSKPRPLDALFTLQNAQLINLCPCPTTVGVQLSTGPWQGYDTQGSGRSRQHPPPPPPDLSTLPPPPPTHPPSRAATFLLQKQLQEEPDAEQTDVSLRVTQVSCRSGC